MWKGDCVFWPIEHNILKEFEVSFLCLSGIGSTTSIRIESVMCFVLFSIFYDEAGMLLVNILVSKAENEHARRMFGLVYLFGTIYQILLKTSLISTVSVLSAKFHLNNLSSQIMHFEEYSQCL